MQMGVDEAGQDQLRAVIGPLCISRIFFRQVHGVSRPGDAAFFIDDNSAAFLVEDSRFAHPWKDRH